jgi:hypothetical protein
LSCCVVAVLIDACSTSQRALSCMICRGQMLVLSRWTLDRSSNALNHVWTRLLVSSRGLLRWPVVRFAENINRHTAHVHQLTKQRIHHRMMRERPSFLREERTPPTTSMQCKRGSDGCGCRELSVSANHDRIRFWRWVSISWNVTNRQMSKIDAALTTDREFDRNERERAAGGC